ncbi:Asp23/Gls24 family envelope stress response protein [Pseudonocardia sp. GCM10023141]|uniref:Asp23/Gls24 family envelope stress response protein n=1 Tax=Pseudonocardia sp. GCM10023141 TaxID=3252653 RepID=UPI0036073AE7
MTGREHQERVSSADRLVCGRLVDDVIEQVARGAAGVRDQHQRGCVHCQAALADYQRRWTPLANLAAETVAAPDGKIDQLLRRLRATLAHPDYAIVPGPDGALRIAARVIMVTARETAQQVPGVRVALGSAAPDQDPAVIAGVAGTSTAIEITIAAGYGYNLQELSQQVRTTVAATIQELTGLTTVEITVIVDDVLP